jgi:hypothetical protein
MKSLLKEYIEKVKQQLDHVTKINQSEVRNFGEPPINEKDCFYVISEKANRWTN